MRVRVRVRICALSRSLYNNFQITGLLSVRLRLMCRNLRVLTFCTCGTICAIGKMRDAFDVGISAVSGRAAHRSARAFVVVPGAQTTISPVSHSHSHAAAATHLILVCVLARSDKQQPRGHYLSTTRNGFAMRILSGLLGEGYIYIYKCMCMCTYTAPTQKHTHNHHGRRAVASRVLRTSGYAAWTLCFV